MVEIVESVFVDGFRGMFQSEAHLEIVSLKREASGRQLKMSIQSHDCRSWCRLAFSRRTANGHPRCQLQMPM